MVRTQLAFGLLGGLTIASEGKYRMVHFQGRRWDWVDPFKDSMGRQNDLAMRITSPQRVMRERGLDPEDILREWQEYEKMVGDANLAPTEFREAAPEILKLFEPLSDGEQPHDIASVK